MTATGIAIIGGGMIGAAHASGYRLHIPRFPGLGATLATVCDANAAQAEKLAATWGFARTAADWQEVVADPRIGIVSVCLPNTSRTRRLKARNLVSSVDLASDLALCAFCNSSLALTASLNSFVAASSAGPSWFSSSSAHASPVGRFRDRGFPRSRLRFGREGPRPTRRPRFCRRAC